MKQPLKNIKGLTSGGFKVQRRNALEDLFPMGGNYTWRKDWLKSRFQAYGEYYFGFQSLDQLFPKGSSIACPGYTVSYRHYPRLPHKRNVIDIHARSKKDNKPIKALVASLFAGCCLIQPVLLPDAMALPTGESVKAGNVTISRNGKNMRVDSSSNRSIVEYQSFDIDSDESVHFQLPGRTAAILNRVTGGNPSDILGSLSSNGQVLLVNPAGIIFGAGAQVNVGSLIASTLNIQDADFLAGNYVFRKGSDHPGASVINQGTITTENGGSVVLMASHVENQGTINAPAGRVHMAVGEQISLVMDQDVVVDVNIDEGLKDAVQEYADAIKNSGNIQAAMVAIKAKLAEAVYTRAVNNTGRVDAQGVAFGPDGSIVFEAEGAQGQGLIVNAGEVIANGQAGGPVELANGGSIRMEGNEVQNFGQVSAQGAAFGEGGTIEFLGDKVKILEGSNINASGDVGGGTVLIGGDYQGSNGVRTSDLTYVGENTQIKADAITSGDGGKVVVWSDDKTAFYGDISAKGGANSGDGGFVEVSGKQFLAFDGDVDTTAANGQMGQLLLDPTNVRVVAAGAESSNRLDVDAFADPDIGGDGETTILNTALQVNSNITIQATNNVTFDAIVTNANAGRTLTVQANNDINVNQALTFSGTMNLYADNDGNGTGNLNINANVTSNNNNINLMGSQFDINNTVNAGTGDIWIGATTAKTIELGGATDNADSALKIDISAAEFGRIRGDMLAIGDNSLNSDINVIGNYAIPNSGAGSFNLYVESGKDVTIGGAISTGTGRWIEYHADNNITVNSAISTGQELWLYADDDQNGTGLFTLNAAITMTSGNAVWIKAADVDINSTIDAGGSWVRIEPNTDAVGIQIGSATDNNDTVGNLDLSFAEMGRISAGTLELGNGGWAGAVTTGGAIVMPGAGAGHYHIDMEGDNATISHNITMAGSKRFEADMNNGITITGNITTASGNIELDSDDDSNAVGSMTLNGTLTTTSGDILLEVGEHLDINNTMNSGTGIVDIVPKTSRQIRLGGATDDVDNASYIDISAAELGRITTTDLTIGTTSLGGTITTAGNFTTSGMTLNLLNSGNITLSNNITTTNQALYVETTGGNITVGGTLATGSGGFIILANSYAGQVTINGSVTSSGATTNAIAGGYLDLNGTVNVGAGGTLNIGTPWTTVFTNVGSASDTELGAGNLVISQAELGRITAGTVNIGSLLAGNGMSVDGPITIAAAGAGAYNLNLLTQTGNITFNNNITTNGQNLALTTGTGAISGSGNINTNGGSITLTADQTLSGTSRSLTTTGTLTSGNGNITLKADDITVSNTINAGTGTVSAISNAGGNGSIALNGNISGSTITADADGTGTISQIQGNVLTATNVNLTSDSGDIGNSLNYVDVNTTNLSFGTTGNAYIQNANDVVLGALTIQANKEYIVNTTGNITATGVITAGNNASLKMYANNNITIQQNVTGSSLLTMELFADNDGNNSGNFTLNSGATLNSANGNITIRGSQIDLNGNINSGTGFTRLATTSNKNIQLGLATDNNDSGALMDISAPELGRITANQLIIGDTNYTGNLDVNGAFTVGAGIGSLRLENGNSVNFNAIITTNNKNITAQSNYVDINTTINAGTGTIYLLPRSGQQINVGAAADNNDAGAIYDVSLPEMLRLTAANVEIGSTGISGGLVTAGNISGLPNYNLSLLNQGNEVINHTLALTGGNHLVMTGNTIDINQAVSSSNGNTTFTAIGADGDITVDANITNSGTGNTILTASGTGDITQTQGFTITNNNAITFNTSTGSVGTSGNFVDVNVNTLNIASGGSAYVNETNDVTLASASVGANQTLAVYAGNNQTVSGAINAGSGQTVDLRAANNFNLANTLTGSSGNITLMGDSDSNGTGTITVNQVLSTSGNINIQGQTVNVAQAITTSGGGDITITSTGADGDITQGANITGDVVTIDANGTGDIIQTQGFVATATTLNLNSDSGDLGALANPFDFNATNINPTTTGSMYLNSLNNVTLGATAVTAGETLLFGSNGTLNTTGNITGGSGSNIILESDLGLTLGGNISTQGTGYITLTADRDANGTGALTTNGTIGTQAGNITLSGASVDVNGTVTASTTGDLTISTSVANGNISADANMTADVVNITLTGTGNLTQTGGTTITGNTANLTIANGSTGTMLDGTDFDVSTFNFTSTGTGTAYIYDPNSVALGTVSMTNGSTFGLAANNALTTTSNVAIGTGSNLTLASYTTATITNTLTATGTGTISILGDTATLNVNAAVTTDSGAITIDADYGNAGSGTSNINGAVTSNSAPITISGQNINTTATVSSTSGNIDLNTTPTFNGSIALGGNVTTTGNTNITATGTGTITQTQGFTVGGNVITLAAGTGSIGSGGNYLDINGTTLNATTGGSVYVNEVDSITLNTMSVGANQTMVVTAGQDITVGSAIDATSGRSVGFRANDDLTLNANITGDSGSITLRADEDSSGAGNLVTNGTLTTTTGNIVLRGATIDVNSSITTAALGGDLTATTTGADGDITIDASISADQLTLTGNGTGDILLNQNLNAGDSYITATGTGNILQTQGFTITAFTNTFTAASGNIGAVGNYLDLTSGSFTQASTGGNIYLNTGSVTLGAMSVGAGNTMAVTSTTLNKNATAIDATSGRIIDLRATTNLTLSGNITGDTGTITLIGDSDSSGAGNLIINGSVSTTSGNMTLNGATVDINSAVTASTTGDITINGTGASGNITLDHNVTADVLTINANGNGSITQTQGFTAVANTINLSSTNSNIGASGNYLDINANTLNASTAQNIYINEIDSVTLNTMSVGAARTMAVTAGQDLTVGSAITATSGRLIDLRAADDLTVGAAITGDTANISLTSDSDSSGGGNLVINSGLTTTSGNIVLAGATVDVNSALSASTTGDLVIVTSGADGDITLDANITSDQAIMTTSGTGDITQTNGNLLTANLITLNSTGGSIGTSGNYLDVNAGTFNGLASGNIYVNEADSVTLGTLSVGAGNTIAVTAGQDITMTAAITATSGRVVDIRANDDLTVSGNITGDTGNLTLRADADSSGAGNFISNNTLTTTSGNISIQGATADINNTINASTTGDVTITTTGADGDISQDGNITADVITLDANGTGDVTQTQGFVATANTLNISSDSGDLGALANPFDFSSGAINPATTGSMYLNSLNNVTLGATTVTAGETLLFGSDGTLTTTGAITGGVNSNIILESDLTLTVGDTLTTQGTGYIRVTADLDENNTGNLVSNGAITTQNGSITLEGNAIDINSTVTSTSGNIDINTSTGSSGNIDLDANISTTGDLTVTTRTTGNIQQTDGNTLTANTVTFNTGTGDVGSIGNFMDTSANALNIASSGSAFVSDFGNIALNNIAVGNGETLFVTATQDLTTAQAIDATNGKIITLTASDDLTLGAAISGDTANITLTADSDSSGSGNLVVNGGLTTTSGGMTLQGATVDINNTLTASAGGDLSLLTTGADGDIFLDGNISVDQISMTANGTGDISQTQGFLLSGSTLNINGGTGNIGSFANHLDTAVSTLNLTTNGSTYIDNTGNLTFGAFTQAAGRDTDIYTTGNLTVSGAVVAGNGSNLYFEATGNVTLNNTITGAASGYIELSADDEGNGTGNLLISNTITGNGSGLQLEGVDITLNSGISTTSGDMDFLFDTLLTQNAPLSSTSGDLNFWGGGITMNENITTGGNVIISTTGTGNVTQTQGFLVTASNLNLYRYGTGSTGSAGNYLDVDVTTINTLDHWGGNVYVRDANNVTLGTTAFNNAGAFGVSIQAGGNIGTSAAVNLMAGNWIELIAANDVTLSNAISGSTGNVTVRGDSDFSGAGNLVLNAGITTTSGNIDLQGATVDINNTVTASTTGNLTVASTGADGDISLDANITANQVTMTANGTGDILQTNGNTLVGSTLTLNAGSGNIGAAANYLDVNATTLNASTTGNIYINEADSVTLNTMSVGAGNSMAVTAAQDITVGSALNATSGRIIDLRANDDLTITGNITGDTANLTLRADNDASGAGNFISNGTLTTTSGNIAIQGATADINGDITASTTGDVTLTTTGADGDISQDANITADIITLDANGTGDVTQTQGFVATANTLNISSDSGDLGALANPFDFDATAINPATTGSMYLNSLNNVTLGATTVNAGETLLFGSDGTLTTTGAITGGVNSNIILESDLDLTVGDTLTTQGTGYIRVTADLDEDNTGNLVSNGAITTQNGNITLEGNAIDINSTVSTTTGNININTSNNSTGNIDLDANISTGTNLTITAQTTGNIQQTNGNLMTAGTINFNAGTGDVGSAGNAVDMNATVANIATSGSVYLNESNSVTLSNVAFGNGDTLSVTAAMDLTSSNAIDATGGSVVNFQAGDDLTLNGIINGDTGSVTLNADSDTSGAGNLVTNAAVTTTSGNIVLGGATVDVNGAINASTGDLTLTTTGADGDVSLDANIAVDQANITANGTGDILQTNGNTLGGTTLTLAAGSGNIGAAGNYLDINGDTLNASTSGNIYIHETDSVTLNTMSVGAGNTMAVTADQDITVGAALDATGGRVVDLRADASLTLNANITGNTTNLTLWADSNSDGTGNFTSNGTITTTSGNISIQGADVDINSTVTASTTGDITVTALGADGDISQDANITGENITLTASGTGDISQTHGFTANATTINLNSATGDIGSVGNAFDTVTSTLNVNSTGGSAFIRNIGAVTLNNAAVGNGRNIKCILL